MIYLGYFTKKINEGGLARNYAFFKYFFKKKWDIKNMYSEKKLKRLKNLHYGLFLLKKIDNKKIFIHLNSIPLIFVSKFLEIKIYREIIYKIFKKLSENNHLFIEVNDLSFEQAIDLQLPIKKYWLELEEEIYRLQNTHYIFASNLMRSYVVKKYDIDFKNTSVVINGGPKLNKTFIQKSNKYIRENNKIKYIYAGSMNKGRQIKELIEIFKNKKNTELYLIGIWGEWIKEEFKDSNIIYLGNFEEELAQEIVSQCDVGLIPYDDTKFYYNLCYPTKASFYITAGIPFLCTNLKELRSNFNEEVVWFEEISNWENIVLTIKKKEVEIKKINVKKIEKKFLWNNLLGKLKV